MSQVQHITDATFQEEVLKAEKPVIVDFWAPWCGPCRMISPVVEALAEEYDGQIIIAKMNTDENPLTPQRLGIMGIPTLIFYKNGKEEDRVVGVVPRAVLKAKIDDLLS